MQDLNNNGKNDLSDIVDVLKDTTKTFVNGVKDLAPTENSYEHDNNVYETYERPKQELNLGKGLKILRKLLLIWILIQAIPAVLAIVATGVLSIPGVADKVMVYFEGQTEYSTTDDEIHSEQNDNNVADKPDVSTVPDVEDIKDIITNDKLPVEKESKPYGLYAIIGLAVGIVIILLLRVLTTKSDATTNNTDIYNNY